MNSPPDRSADDWGAASTKSPFASLDVDPTLRHLTPRQLAVLQIFEAAWEARCDAPTIEHIQEVMGIRSPNGVISHIKALMRKCCLEVQPPMFRRAGTNSNRYRLTQAAVDRLDRWKRIVEQRRSEAIPPASTTIKVER